MAYYKDSLVAVNTTKDVIRQQKIEKSKKAMEAADKFTKALPASSDITVSRLDLILVMRIIIQLNDSYTEGKLTKEAGLKALGQGLMGYFDGAKWKFVECLGEVVGVMGEFRLEHNPDRPSFRESFDVFRTLVDYDAIEKEILGKPRR